MKFGRELINPCTSLLSLGLWCSKDMMFKTWSATAHHYPMRIDSSHKSHPQVHWPLWQWCCKIGSLRDGLVRDGSLGMGQDPSSCSTSFKDIPSSEDQTRKTPKRKGIDQFGNGIDYRLVLCCTCMNAGMFPEASSNVDILKLENIKKKLSP